ncbi:MAG: DUF853 domain-containing protein, partial [Rhodoglobus sp.]
MTDAAAQVEAAKKALAEAEAALVAATAAAAPKVEAKTEPKKKSNASKGPLSAAEIATTKAGYTFDG